jgi:hypothetical protein
MGHEQPQERASEVDLATAEQFAVEHGLGEVAAWEEVDAGRYMPRRIKGSYKGRALG